MFYSKTARSQSDTLAPGLTKEAKTWSEEVMSSLLKIGKGVGSEQHGDRPVVVIQNDIGNLHTPPIRCDHEQKRISLVV